MDSWYILIYSRFFIQNNKVDYYYEERVKSKVSNEAKE